MARQEGKYSVIPCICLTISVYTQELKLLPKEMALKGSTFFHFLPPLCIPLCVPFLLYFFGGGGVLKFDQGFASAK
jgi:hypothetical protein